MLPILCFTCGNLLGDKQLQYEEFLKRIQDNKLTREQEKDQEKNQEKDFLDKLEIESYCCKMNLMSYIVIKKEY
jgi:DNA-directed RNA polymerase subunit N (RpoN/RPB10)